MTDSADPLRGRGTPIRVASYNTRDFLDDRHAAARIVRAIDPDILCLQEVPRRLFSARRVRQFAAECGLRWPGAHRGSGGTTIFVGEQIAVETITHRRLAVAVPMRTRGYALARLTPARGRPVVVASIHLSLQSGERHAHTGRILASLTDLAGDAGRMIVAGDLNELDTGSTWRLLTGQLRLISPTTPTFPARRPRVPLDAVFATPDLPVLPHTAVDLDEVDVLAASDHRPVWVDVLC